jgi:8-oxo-dGTP pyrophosphatase MutT (NUDIX family)
VRLKALVWIVRTGPRGPEVLLLQRPGRRGGGEHPVTGKAHEGETPIECARREAHEETGIAGEPVPLGLVHRYQGKKSLFEEHSFAMRAPANAAPLLSHEHVAYRWATAEEARQAVHWEAHREALELALAKS